MGEGFTIKPLKLRSLCDATSIHLRERILSPNFNQG